MIQLKTDPDGAAPKLAAERAPDSPLADALIDRAFGPGRFTKVSERVREFAAFAPELSFCAWRGDRMVGVVRQWRVRCGETPVVFLGPIAVEETERSSGVGAMLVQLACDAAKAAGETAIVLVGDEPYFGKFGFSADLAKDVRLPGPVDQRRVLAAAFAPEGEQLSGMVRPL
ncbi:N-acetyltransferase [Phenylobacterium sp.]|uniref:GNAT family N-acetyltransferase n=1 Tax=Phenylobacterium sp. TaxID=1871053 RepID=UPI002DEF7B8B|nr:N-acetyltransferase [Phenylobacterium sp.]